MALTLPGLQGIKSCIRYLDSHPHKPIFYSPGTLRAIPSRVLNRPAKLTSRKPSIQAEAVDTIYPSHANALRKAGLAPPVFPKMGELWGKQDEKVEKNKE